MLAKLSLAGVFGMVDPQEVMKQGDKYGTPGEQAGRHRPLQVRRVGEG